MKTALKYPFVLLFPIVLIAPLPLIFESIALFLACANLVVLSVVLKQKPSWESVLNEPMIWIGFYVLLVDPLTSFLRSDIQIEFRTSRLALFLVPLVFYLFKELMPGIRKPVLTSHIIGVLFYIFYSYGYLAYFYSFVSNRDFSLDHYLRYDLYQYLPGAYHHSYLGMYMTFAIIVIAFGDILKKRWHVLLLILFILANQLFMGGKITLILSILVISVYIWKISTNKKLVLTTFIIAAATTIYMFSLRGLFESLSFSISNRLMSWECSVKAFLENLWIGLGKEGTYKYLEQCVGNNALSTHNQILNELVNYGLLGSWIFIFYWLLIKRSKDDFVFKCWVGLVILLSLSENILSLQRGILFVSFFAVVFMLTREQKKRLTI